MILRHIIGVIAASGSGSTPAGPYVPPTFLALNLTPNTYTVPTTFLALNLVNP